MVEVCYEWSGLGVWGKIVSNATHYSIIQFTAEHNDTSGSWKKGFWAGTQSGHESKYEGIEWNTSFNSTDAVEPIKIRW